MATDKEPLLTRLKKEGPKEVILETLRLAWQYVASPSIAPVWIGIVAVASGAWAWWSSLDPFVRWVFFLLGIGAALWIANQLKALTSSRVKNDALKAPPDTAVEFWLPGKWESGFQFKNLGLDDKTHEV